MNREEQRYHSFRAMHGFYEKLGITYEEFQKDPNIVTLTSAGMYCYDPSVCVKVIDVSMIVWCPFSSICKDDS